MLRKNLDALIITDEKNMYYYAGFYKGEGYVVIRHDRCFVVTDFRYFEYADEKCTGYEIGNISKDGIGAFVLPDMTCGFENGKISYSQYVSFAGVLKNLVGIDDMADSLREVKDEAEIGCIRRAAEIADRAFDHICGFIKEGMSEIEIACEIEYFMRRSGAEKTSFDTIVASGARGSLPHAIPTSNRLKAGELVVMDYGCVVDGYASDMTRTVGVGSIDSSLMDVYNTVLSAQLEALSCIKAGVSGMSVDCAARTMLDFKYPGRFGHSLGHSVGLDIHEKPNLSPKNPKALKAGNVVTVEPGLYIPGKCGVRIEDLVVVTENGCDILSKSPKNLVIVG